MFVVDPQRWRIHLLDVACIVWLWMTAFLLLFKHTRLLTLSQDGFLVNYALFSGFLEVFNLTEVKEPGRPLIGLGWRLADLLTGGSVTGYNAFLFACYTASASLVYVLGRVLLPNQPVWAITAAALKLVWSANHEVFENSGLPIYFAEMLFWAALFLLVSIVSKPGKSGKSIGRQVAMAACLVVVAGTYQTAWPLIVLAPVAIAVARFSERPLHDWSATLACWYVPSVAMMFLCYHLGRSFARQIDFAPAQIGARTLAGLWDTTFGAVYYPFQPSKLYPPAPMSSWLVLAVAGFLVLWLWSSRISWPCLVLLKQSMSLRHCLALAGIGLVATVATLMPPTPLYVPSYGTRFMAWSAAGAILLFLVLIAAVIKMSPLIGTVVAAFVSVSVVAAMTFQLSSIGNYFAQAGFPNRRFWEDASTLMPRLQEGTVVLLNEPPANVIALHDVFSTFVLRAISETHLTFFITDSKPIWHGDSATYEVRTTVDLAQAKPVGHPSRYFRYPPSLPEQRTFLVPADRVIVLSWDASSLRLTIVTERSAMTRFSQDVPSTFGQQLFPLGAIESSRTKASRPLTYN